MSGEPSLLRGARGIGLVSVLLAPFAFGAVGTSAWVPLSWLWIGLALWSLARARPGDGTGLSALSGITPAFLAVHALLLVQLVPLPAAVLRAISPGSYAASFVPPMVVETWAPLTVSPTGTRQAWLFFAGVHGLSVALLAASSRRRTDVMAALFTGMAGVGGLLAVEGLVQAASAHPHWLYGVFPVPGAGSHERGIFGPYYNRDHYSNLLAIAGSVAAGLLGLRLPRDPSRPLRSVLNSQGFSGIVALIGALVLMLAASAASGSRGGLAALGAGVFVGLSSPFLARPRLALGSLLLLLVVLFGTGVPSAVERMGDVDFEVSRLMVWRDASRLIEFFPVFGAGIGAFAPAYWPYQRVVRYEYWPHAHNEYLQWVLEAGAIGVLMALYWLRSGWRIAPRVVRNPEIRPALAGLTAAMIHALVECGLRIPANAAWAGLLLVCVVVGAAMDRERPSQAG